MTEPAPMLRPGAVSSPSPTPAPMPSPRQKAAIIVRLLLAEGSPLPVSALPDHLQTALAEQMGQMRLVDRATLDQVVQEFLDHLEHAGMAFPAGLEAALGMMDGQFSPSATSRLRRLAVARSGADPWDRITALPAERLLPLVLNESIEVAAVLLAKLAVPRAADLLGRLPGERARRIAHAVSLTGNVAPETVRRIGEALVAEMDALPARAFETDPVARVGAILNVSPAPTRDDILSGLDEVDARFADQVRRAIFTYVHVPARLSPRDLPKLVRVVEPATLLTALASGPAEVADFILANISQRMAQNMREEIAALGPIKPRDADAAMTAIVLGIRQLEGAGEITLLPGADEDEA